jgi:hypothetical protein
MAMTQDRLLAAAVALALAALLPGAVGAEEQAPTVQVPPLATEPMPTQGGGQAAVGAAVTGSTPGPGAAGAASPGPAAPSPIDQSQEQQGELLKPGDCADNMAAAAGAGQPCRPKP